MDYNLTLSNIQKHGFRLTKARRKIVKVFSDTTRPLSVNEIADILRQMKIKVDKTTIYREIEFLMRNKYVSEVGLRFNEVSYEPADLMHHHHLVCNGCGKVEVVTNCLVSELEDNILKTKGFNVRTHRLEFYGLCADCGDNKVVN